MPKTFTTIAVRIDGHVAEILLNRPEERNAFTHEMHIELKEAFLAVCAEHEVRAIVLGGAGTVFSAGGDFDLILADRDNADARGRMRQEGRPLLEAIAGCPLPVVVALQGAAVGLGATVALGADAIIAVRTAKISDPHVVIGLAAGDGGCVLWPQHVGLLRAKRYLLTGDRLTAEEAFQFGLVTDLVDTAEEVLPAAHALASRIAALPPLAVQATKKVLNRIFHQTMDAVFEQGLDLEMETFMTDDVAEAISAFRERRRPVYRGT